ncbi:MAG TPA: hypothetical protein V6C81_07800 [Planktothrix sp.]|jgi:hypothetical protein
MNKTFAGIRKNYVVTGLMAGIGIGIGITVLFALVAGLGGFIGAIYGQRSEGGSASDLLWTFVAPVLVCMAIGALVNYFTGRHYQRNEILKKDANATVDYYFEFSAKKERLPDLIKNVTDARLKAAGATVIKSDVNLPAPMSEYYIYQAVLESGKFSSLDKDQLTTLPEQTQVLLSRPSFNLTFPNESLLVQDCRTLLQGLQVNYSQFREWRLIQSGDDFAAIITVRTTRAEAEQLRAQLPQEFLQLH